MMETTCSKCGSDGVIPRHLPKGEHIPPDSGIHNIEKFSGEIEKQQESAWYASVACATMPGR